MSNHLKTLLALALTGALIAGAAQAADPPRTLKPSVTIHFSDLNLNSAEGTRILYGRIRTAAQTVCGPSFSLWDSRRSADWQECYNATIDAAVKRINRPILTALHQQSKGARL